MEHHVGVDGELGQCRYDLIARDSGAALHLARMLHFHLLRTLADHLAAKACRTHREVRLEPMNRHERKIIHMALQENRRVLTYSAGDEPRRYVVIAPKRRRRPRRRDSERRDEE